ncbi:hypothetical protein AWV80_01275 [Cupriavidus sp. UYMU48A]|nr:hypothetical protein AWV80_01275 [Cupriavidus sp. UYMU48A]
MTVESTKAPQVASLLAQYTKEVRTHLWCGRQLLGGIWGSGQLCAGTFISIEDDLPVLTCVVIDATSKIVIGFGNTHAEARDQARWAISTAGSRDRLVYSIAEELAALEVEAS